MVRDRDREQHMALAKARARRSGANVPASLLNAARDYDKTAKHQKQRDRRTKRLDDLLEEPAVSSFLDQLIAIDAADHALAKLDERDRSIVIMRHLEGLSRTAICALLGVREENLKSVLGNALKRMRAP